MLLDVTTWMLINTNTNYVTKYIIKDTNFNTIYYVYSISKYVFSVARQLKIRC
jgi:hypothetical protein